MEGKPRHRSLFHIPSVEFQQTLEVVAGFECTVFLLRWLEEQTGKGTGEALRTILCPLARASPENDTLCKITFDTVVYAAQKTLRCRFLNAFEQQISQRGGQLVWATAISAYTGLPVFESTHL